MPPGRSLFSLAQSGVFIPALHIYHSDGSVSSLATATHDITGPVTRIGCCDNASSVALFQRFPAASPQFDRIIIDTHGSPSEIGFGDDATFHDGWFCDQRSFASPGAHILFSGRNVADGAVALTHRPYKA